MIIKKATKKDISTIVKLVKQMVDYHCQIDEYYKPFSEYKKLEDHIEKSLKDKNTRVIVAEENERLIGFFMGAIEKAPIHISPRRIGVIYDAFIEKHYRNRGVGKKLFNELMKWFKKEKVKHLELSVDARNKIGVRAWKKFGFFEYRLKMRLDL